MTASLGVAEVLDVDNVGTLIKRADEALYSAKKAGREIAFVYHERRDPVCRPPDEQASKSAQTVKPAETRSAPASTLADAAGVVGKRGSFPVECDSRTAPENTAPSTLQPSCGARISECQQFKLPLTMLVVDVDDLPKLTTQWGSAGG